MTIALISFVLLLGIVFIFLEIFVIPGTTIFAFAGIALSGAAIFFAYKLLGSNYGHLTVVLGFVVFIIMFFLGRKLMNEDQLALKQELTGKVNELEAKVVVGDLGKSLTDLKPNGKAIFNDEKIEVFSTGAFIEKDLDLQIIKIEQNKIIVKPLN